MISDYHSLQSDVPRRRSFTSTCQWNNWQ